MSERENPDIDLKALFAAIDGTISAGGNVSDLFEDPSKSPNSSVQERIKLLDVFLIKGRSFKELAHLDIRQTANVFKNGFEIWKKEVLERPDIPAEEKVFIESTTIAELASAAQVEFERQSRLLGQQTPNSVGYEAVNEQAHKWEVVSTIVRGASEIRD